MKSFIYIGFALVVISGVWSVYSTYMDLRGFKDQVLDQQTKILESVARQERKLNHAVTSITDQAYQDASAIDEHYRALLDKRQRLRNSTTNSGAKVSADTSTAENSRHTTQAKSFAACGEISRKLSKCEQRLIYEAKEFDILATHFNALLAIYKQVQEVQQNGNNEKDGGKEKHH